LLLAREANVVIEDAAFAQELRAGLVSAMQTHGVKLDEKGYAKRPWQQRALDWLAFGAMRLMLLLAGRRY
jgi:cardiolipin synthase